MFHQPHNTFGSHIYNAALYTDACYPAHFHKSFELLYARRGSNTVFVKERPYRLREGDCCLVFPYESHAFRVEEGTALFVSVFSGEYVPELHALAQKQSPSDPVFRPGEDVRTFLSERFFYTGEPDAYTLRGALYLLCADFFKQVTFAPRQKRDDLVLSIIRYVEDHYREPITEHTMAVALGYHEQYLSRAFRSVMQMNFRDLVNQYRLEDALARLSRGGVTVTQAALDSGFQSVRTFNRVRREAEKGK
ncbi:MAG: helix-turn-helix transcriptional regulator [Clostridia bacterium]|nr:helix-turn-helix transcriptional regulator [Clostridia bacterium]